MSKKEDWRRDTPSASLSVSLKIGSPVVFVKSARTMVSLSVSGRDDRARHANSVPETRTRTATAPPSHFQFARDLAAGTARDELSISEETSNAKARSEAD